MHDGEKKNFLTLLLLLLQIHGLLGLDTSGVAKEPKVIDLTLVLKNHLYEYMDQITQTDPIKVLGLRLVQVDGKNFYTEQGILSLETGATASIQVLIDYIGTDKITHWSPIALL